MAQVASRNLVVGWNCLTVIDLVDDGFAIQRIGDRLAHQLVLMRKTSVDEVELCVVPLPAWRRLHCKVAVLAYLGKLTRIGMGDEVEFILQQRLQTSRRI